MFDFEVRHISARKHTVTDGLSWRPLTAANIGEAKAEGDIDEFILAELNSLRVFPDDSTSILADKYLDDSQKIATYLTTLR